jgi:hypothetical protein
VNYVLTINRRTQLPIARPEPRTIELFYMGRPGIQGEKGDKGDKGDPGDVVGADKHFSQAFNVASSVTVNHNLGKYPAVTVVNSAGDEVEGLVEHVSANSVSVSFSAPFSGVVYLN